MELFEREKTLEERERKVELREIELEKISYKLAVTCQTKVNTHQITEQLQVKFRSSDKFLPSKTPMCNMCLVFFLFFVYFWDIHLKRF